MIIIIYLFIFIYLISVLKSIIRFYITKQALKKIRYDERSYKAPERIQILIPVLKEEKLVKRSIEYFTALKDLVDVTYITTSREDNRKTYDEIMKWKIALSAENIFVVNSPNKKGNMATQLNYAASKLSKDTIIGVYNVDSFPDRRCFEEILRVMMDKNVVVQQVSFFDDNVKGILKVAQMWQNRWSLIYEYCKYLNYNNLKFTYTIGHGFFIYHSKLAAVGYWDDDEMNEDNIMGYKLHLNNTIIKTVPFFEKAQFANNLTIYIKQQSVWFNGPIYAFKYLKKVRSYSFRNFFLAMQNFKNALSWAFFPPVLIFFTLISIAYNPISFIAIIVLTTIYVTVLNLLVQNELVKIGALKEKRHITFIIIEDYVFLLIHSIGPLITLLKIIIRRNDFSKKYKTEK